jgi:hypothetical protein
MSAMPPKADANLRRELPHDGHLTIPYRCAEHDVVRESIQLEAPIGFASAYRAPPARGA